MCDRCAVDGSMARPGLPAETSRRALLAGGLGAALVLVTGGCGGGTNDPRAGGGGTGDGGLAGQGAAQGPIAPITNTDPCAMQLHDLCGALLLYYQQVGDLPGRIEELKQVPILGDQVKLTCPVSGQPYLYNPIGVVDPNRPTRVILYDPAPSHSGYRWVVQITEPTGDEALIAKVIALPESAFSLTIPTRRR